MAVILLTGASSGIGYEAALKLSSQGHKVYAGARRLDKMAALAEKGVVTLPLDVTDEASIRAFVASVMEKEGRIDVLINNAGFGYFGAIENVPLEEARRQMEVNLFGLAAMTKEVLPILRAQHGGRIVNVSSVAGRSVLLYGGWYHVSKYSVEAFSDALRIEMKPFGVKVVMIEPGGIKTNWGFIAARLLEESSRGTAYEKNALNEAYWLNKGYSGNFLSSPKVVARAISCAVNRRWPCARYAVGLGAFSLLFLHAVLPTCLWDGFARLLGKLPRRG
ncbi:MAG: SDR family NAD(P)-dependent oxidoreductase [Bacteroidales bacterium]|nr:SDR family NAD(P)-dependent oxidoreductase [Bacteroidales bacterium]